MRDLNGSEYVSGRHADYSPGSPDIPKVAATLRRLQETRCPPESDQTADL
jgi:hypothetical protein